MSAIAPRATVRRIGGFLVSGTAGFLTDLGLLTVLTAAGVGPLAARVPAVFIAVTVTWLFNRRLTFAVEQPPSLAEYGRYLAVSGLSVAVNYLVYASLVLGGIMPQVALAGGSAVAMVVSYLGYGRLVFGRPGVTA
jgi:putative flippase GtrA